MSTARGIKHVCICVFIISALWICFAKGMTVVPQRAWVTYENPKYLINCSMNIRRYGRKSAYYMNAFGFTYHTWTNNITTELSVKQYLHNEYRNSFVTFKFKFCDLIHGEPNLGRMLTDAGVKCPLLAGNQYLHNLTVRSEDFPNVFPFEKGRGDVTFSLTATGEIALQVQVEVIFKQKLKGK